MKVLCTTHTGVTALGQTMRVIAVAKVLHRRGHAVRVLAGEKQAAAVAAHGLDLVKAAVPAVDGAGFGIWSQTVDQAQLEQMVARVREILPVMIEAEKKVVADERPDVALCGSFTGPASARACGVPAAMVLLGPHGPKTVELMTRRFSASAREAIHGFLAAAGLLIVEGMPEVDAPMGDALWAAGLAALKDKIRYTGPLLVEDPDHLPSQKELKRRHGMDPDRPLVYVTIGGGTPLIGEEFLSLVLEAFRLLPQLQGVVACGLALDPGRLANPPANVAVRGFVPGTELIKAADVTVFHGGSSTLMTCIACGRPAVVVPSMAEQEDNADVLARHGAGMVLDKAALTARALGGAVQAVLEDESFRLGAQRLRELSRRYGGAEAAASMVEALAGGGPH